MDYRYGPDAHTPINGQPTLATREVDAMSYVVLSMQRMKLDLEIWPAKTTSALGIGQLLILPEIQYFSLQVTPSQVTQRDPQQHVDNLEYARI
jgi:hypothetical protein